MHSRLFKSSPVAFCLCLKPWQISPRWSKSFHETISLLNCTSDTGHTLLVMWFLLENKGPNARGSMEMQSDAIHVELSGM